MTTPHTQLPWHVGTRSGFSAHSIMAYDGEEEFKDTAICSVYGIPVNTRVDEVSERYAEGIANAAHIVKCVNERDTLLRERDAFKSALKAVGEEMKALDKGHTAMAAQRDALREALGLISKCPEEHRHVDVLMNIARAALATAGGGDE